MRHLTTKTGFGLRDSGCADRTVPLDVAAGCGANLAVSLDRNRETSHPVRELRIPEVRIQSQISNPNRDLTVAAVIHESRIPNPTPESGAASGQRALGSQRASSAHFGERLCH
jgi:hypothetical protein